MKNPTDIAREFALTLDVVGFFIPPVELLEQFILSVQEGRISNLTETPTIKIRLEPDALGSPAVRIQTPGRTDAVLLPGEAFNRDDFNVRFDVKNYPPAGMANPNNETDAIASVAIEIADAWIKANPAARKWFFTNCADLAALLQRLAAAFEHLPRSITPDKASPPAGVDLDPAEFCEICKAELHATDGLTVLDNSTVKVLRFCGQYCLISLLAYKATKTPKDPPPIGSEAYGPEPAKPIEVAQELESWRTCDYCKERFQGGAQVTPTGMFCSETCRDADASGSPRSVVLNKRSPNP